MRMRGETACGNASGECRVTEYKLYCLDHEGRNVEAKSITASTDEEAVRQATALEGLRQCEIWRGHHLVAKVTEFEPVG
jgi:hypothetical protein